MQKLRQLCTMRVLPPSSTITWPMPGSPPIIWWSMTQRGRRPVSESDSHSECFCNSSEVASLLADRVLWITSSCGHLRNLATVIEIRLGLGKVAAPLPVTAFRTAGDSHNPREHHRQWIEQSDGLWSSRYWHGESSAKSMTTSCPLGDDKTWPITT